MNYTSKESQLNVTSEKPLQTPPLCKLAASPPSVLRSYILPLCISPLLVHLSPLLGYFSGIKYLLFTSLSLAPSTMSGMQEVKCLLNE